MIDGLFRLLLIVLLVAGTYALYGLLNEPGIITFSSPTVEGELHALYPEILFLFVGWILFLFMIHLRLSLLLGLVGGQALLVQPYSTVRILGDFYPIYALIAVNCLYLLMLYFYFTSEQWASGSLEDANEVYKRND
jgi:hypothetical protein